MSSEMVIENLDNTSLIEQTFEFWFSDHDHIRTPFPSYIHDQLKTEAVSKFYEWTSKLKEDARKEINDEIICEKFEEIIFETAIKLVSSDDERITINYPFMPRVGDKINQHLETNRSASVVVSRTIIKEGDKTMLELKLREEGNNHLWETQFELPV